MKKAAFLIIACLIFEITYAQPDSTASSKIHIDIHGFILMNGVYDLNGLENYDDFTTSEIPIDPTPGEKMDRLYLSVRQSRIGLSAFYPSSLGLIKGVISADFYSDALHYHSFFRLRDAYIQMDHLLIGKSLTTFGDSEVLPNTIDFEGPNSASGNRNTMIKYFNNINAKFKYTLAIEAPGSDILGFTDTGKEYQSIPSFIASIKNHGNWGLISLSGLINSSRYINTDSINKRELGYGVALSSIIKISKQNKISVFAIAGKGVANYIADLSGSGYNGIFNAQNNQLHLLNTLGGYIVYTQYWSPRLSSNFIYSYIQLESSELLEEEDFHYSNYALVNLFYNPIDRLNFGIEYVWGQLFVQNNKSGTANRIQCLVQFTF